MVSLASVSLCLGSTQNSLNSREVLRQRTRFREHISGKNTFFASCVVFVFVGASASTMLPSAEFICLHVVYCEAFWEELSRLT